MAAQREDDRRVARAVGHRGALLPFAGALALAVVLYGGYVGGWSWTGFSDNDTLWDWLQLLLLPVAVAALPIWMRKSHLMRPRLRRALRAALGLFCALVLAGYLAPLAWTGFVGNTLWDWLKLVVLPAVLVLLPAIAADRGMLGRRHRVGGALAAAGLLAAVLGGYLLGWRWTGFEGNTLWDWIQLVLLPLIVPTLLTPRAMAWIAAGVEEAESAFGGGGADRREAAADGGGRAADGGGRAADGGTAAPGAADGSYLGPRGRAALTAAGLLVAAGIVGGHAAVDHGHRAAASASAGDRARPATPAADCARPGARTVAAAPGTRVVRAGARFTACPARGPAVALGTAHGPSGPGAFAVGAGRVVWADDHCAAGAARRCSSRVEVLRVGVAKAFVRRSFALTGGIAGLWVDAAGAVAAMIRPPCAVSRCPGGRVVLLDRRGAVVTAQGPGVDAGSLAGRGRTVFWLEGGVAASARLAR
jgi:hypothetical protein